MQIALRDRARLAGAVVHGGVEVADLAEAVAAQLQRRGHEAEAPLADVEGRAADVVGRGVAVGHHHLGEREPVRDRPGPRRRRVADVCRVRPSRSLNPSRSASSASGPLAVDGERDAVGLADLQRPPVGRAARSAGHVRGTYSPITAGRLGRRGVLDLQQLHRVQVDDECSPLTGAA